MTEHMPKDQPLKRSVVGAYLIRQDGQQFARPPCLNQPVIDGVRHADHFSGRMTGVVVNARRL
jgi:hypothetical protein